jgi:hypothetical protein
MTRLETFLQRAYRAIEAGIQAIDAELAAAEKSVDASEDLLRKIRESLVEMRGDLEAGGPKWPLAGYGYVIADSWPRSTPLGGAILHAEHKYKDARKAMDRKRGRSKNLPPAASEGL